ncbi:hypothetical protein NYE76_16030 [Paenibacillus sp. FSL M7-0831]|nr:hypothetical protein [Paenibacillus macerans]
MMMRSPFKLLNCKELKSDNFFAHYNIYHRVCHARDSTLRQFLLCFRLFLCGRDRKKTMPSESPGENLRAKKGVIPALSPIERGIGTIYAAIFPNRKEMPANCTIHRKISTKNAANGDEYT